MRVHHLNCVKIESPLGSAIGHCLLLERGGRLTLIDSGIGLGETVNPEQRLGKELIEVTGFRFDESLTAVRQIEKLGFPATAVTDIVCSHLDPDHIGGLADFPHAVIHVSQEEHDAFKGGDSRYLPQQLSHNPRLKLYAQNDGEWFNLPARGLDLDITAYLIPLPGHTAGHCGVVIKDNERWIFYVGDAYYLRAELDNHNHPVDQLATLRAVDEKLRRESLEKVRQIVARHGKEIEYFGYHDPTEFIT